MLNVKSDLENILFDAVAMKIVTCAAASLLLREHVLEGRGNVLAKYVEARDSLSFSTFEIFF